MRTKKERRSSRKQHRIKYAQDDKKSGSNLIGKIAKIGEPAPH
jgi:hypothetical protein